MSINEAKWTLSVSLCFKNNLLLALDFLQLPCWDCFELLPFLVHWCFCIRNFHHLWHRNKLVNQIVVGHRSISLACNVILMVFRLQRFCSLSRRFMRFHNTITHCVEHLFIANLRLCARFHDAWMSFTRHRGSHRSSILLLAFSRISEYSLSCGSMK